MSLKDPSITPTQQPETLPAADLQTSTPTPTTNKKQKPTDELYKRTLEVAENWKAKSWSDAKDGILADYKKQYPTEKQPSKSTVYRAHREVTAEKRKLQEAQRSQTPKLDIVNEKPKTAEFLDQNKGTIEELPSADQTGSTEAATAAGAGQQPADIEYVKDMLRGIHIMVLSKDGILGEKYGRSKEQVVAASDQLYRYLSKRVTVEQLENYDTAFLVLAYLPLIIGILNEFRKERAKKPKEQKP